MSAKDVDALKNPPKGPNAAATAAMASSGDLMKKQQDANAAAGVDARGIPLAKSSLPTAAEGAAPNSAGGAPPPKNK